VQLLLKNEVQDVKEVEVVKEKKAGDNAGFLILVRHRKDSCSCYWREAAM